MKGAQLFIGAAIISFSFLVSCKDAPKADDAVTTEAKETTTNEGTAHTVDIGQSNIEWVGTKPTGRHHGTFKVKEGTLTVNNNMVTGGKFIIDVASVQPDDQDEKGNAKLQGHLKSEDFFDVTKYPEGSFEITQVQDGSSDNSIMKDATHTVTGNLTLKDQTKSISFPAKINMAENEITTDANFNIDRTQWGIVYGSDKSLGDKFINPEVNIKLHIVAKK